MPAGANRSRARRATAPAGAPAWLRWSLPAAAAGWALTAAAHVPRDDAPAPEDMAALAAAALARPLFTPGRRPEPPLPAASAAPDTAAPPRLSATILSAGRPALAILVPAAAGGPVTVREGERAGGWLVLRIASGEVVAESAEGRHVLHVSYDRQEAAAAARFEPAPDPRTRTLADQDE